MTHASAFHHPTRAWPADFTASPVKFALAPLYALTAAPSLLFLAALAAMLLRHPDVQFHEIDRIAFGLLLVGVLGRAIVERQPLVLRDRIVWPMLGLVLISVASLLFQPFDHEAWSLLAAKFVVPFTLFYLAQLIFTNEDRFFQFEIFSLVVLAYLSFTSIAFLSGARSLIFPRFILDDSLGFHADRARGPLLQAVANGVSLNLLGLLAWHACRRRILTGAKAVLLLASLPVAILATMTRAVWLSFAGSILWLVLSTRTIRRTALILLLLGGFGFSLLLCSTQVGETLCERLEERGPLDYRQAVYSGSWQMFLEHPLTGWGFHAMPTELPRYVSGYNEKALYPHNTYLELLVEEGVIGLAFYLWLMWELWRLGYGPVPGSGERGFLNQQFHKLWPILLAVYWLNAAVVVMSYQFVNALLFTLAGMLAAQRRRTGISSC